MKRAYAIIVFQLASAALMYGCGDNGTGRDVVGQDSLVQDTAADSAGQDAAGQDTAAPDVATDEGRDSTGSDVTADTGGDTGGDAGTDAAVDAVQPVFIGLNQAYSECGGFTDVLPVRSGKPADSTTCGDEKLLWSTDSENGLMHFTNVDAFLNCCGSHGIDVYMDGDTYVIAETDAPEDMEGRCNCMCLFDFAVDMPAAAGTIQVRIERLVTDEMAQADTVWEGTIDLTPGSGEVLIEENVGWCYDAVNVGVNAKFSACGGFADAFISRVGQPADGTCPDETLNWTYDAETRVLSFLDADVELNCCGAHDMAIYDTGSAYIIQETDAPDTEQGRCKCMCTFDFSIDLPGQNARVVDLSLVRDITDSDIGPETIWEGSIDLNDGSGQVVVHDNGEYCI